MYQIVLLGHDPVVMQRGESSHNTNLLLTATVRFISCKNREYKATVDLDISLWIFLLFFTVYAPEDEEV